MRRERAIGSSAASNAVVYDILFKASAETMITIAADPKHLGAKIGITAGIPNLFHRADLDPSQTSHLVKKYIHQ